MMRKLRLDVDDLRVQSFTTGRDRLKAGTVRGNDASDPFTVCCATDNCTQGTDCTFTNYDSCLGCDGSGAASCGNYCTDLTFCGQTECGSGGETCYGEPGTCYSACVCRTPARPC